MQVNEKKEQKKKEENWNRLKRKQKQWHRSHKRKIQCNVD